MSMTRVRSRRVRFGPLVVALGGFMAVACGDEEPMDRDPVVIIPPPPGTTTATTSAGTATSTGTATDTGMVTMGTGMATMGTGMATAAMTGMPMPPTGGTVQAYGPCSMSAQCTGTGTVCTKSDAGGGMCAPPCTPGGTCTQNLYGMGTPFCANLAGTWSCYLECPCPSHLICSDVMLGGEAKRVCLAGSM